MKTFETLKDKLLRRLPKKYHNRVKNIYYEEGLVDDCKYMLYYSDNYTDGECAGGTYPVRNITEAVEFIKSLTEVEKE